MKRKKYKYEQPKTIKDCWEEAELMQHVENPNATLDEFVDFFLVFYGHIKVKHKLKFWYKLAKPIRMRISHRKLKKTGIIK